MKAVRTLPLGKRADSLFLCVLLTALVLRSTTPCPSLSPEKTSAPPQPKPRRSTPILLSWCVILRSPHVVQRISPRSLKIHVRRFRNTPTPRTKYRTTNERIPLFLPAFLSALSPHVSIRQRPIIRSGLWGADACGGGRGGGAYLRAARTLRSMRAVRSSVGSATKARPVTVSYSSM